MGKHAAPGSVWAWPGRIVVALVIIGVTGSTVGIVAARLQRRTGGPRATPTLSPGRSPSPGPSPSIHTTPSPEPSVPPPPVETLRPSTGPRATVYGEIKTKQNVVFLTIDDGYVIDERVAALIERERIPVTLFLVEGAARANQAFFRRLVRAGATVENHTVSHQKLTSLGYDGQRRAICGAMDGFTRMFGRRPTMFRPPYGSMNDTTRLVVRSCGMSAILTWSAIMNNGYIAEQDHVLNAGELILMHFRKDLYDNLQTIIRECKKRNLAFGRLEDYIPRLPSAAVSR